MRSYSPINREATPKLHTLLYHVWPQMGFLGSSGILHEGYVETAHAKDNAIVPRFRHVQNPEQRVELRMRVHWQASAKGAINIRRMEQEANSYRRACESSRVRSAREQAAHTREERLARQDAEGEPVVRVVRMRLA
jgi:hypothetical protein